MRSRIREFGTVDALSTLDAQVGVASSPRIASPKKQAVRRFLRHRLAVVGLALIGLTIVLAIVGDEAAAYRQNISLAAVNQPPGRLPDHPLGTDSLGRDVLARVLVGGRVSILVALVSVSLATLIGGSVGLTAGYLGGFVDGILMRVVDVLLSFPTILLLLVLASFVGPGMGTLIVIVAVVSWAPAARIVRGQVLAVRENTYVEAARVVGVPRRRMITAHILPNVVAPLVVFSTFAVAGVIIFEASLSYLGLGVQQPTPSWGNLVNGARSVTVLERYVWQWIPPAAFIVATVMGVNFVGDGLRDALDQRLTSEAKSR